MDYKIEIARFHADKNEIFMYLEARQNQHVLGYVNVVVNKNDNCVECDTAVKPEYRGLGIASKLLDCVLKRVFVEKCFDDACKTFAKGTETQKIVLSIDMDNFASRAVAEKKGFVNCGANAHDSVEYVLTKDSYFQQLQEGKELR